MTILELKNRIVCEGDNFWTLLNRKHVALIDDLLKKTNGTEGCVAIRLGDDSIYFKTDHDFNPENLQPSEALIFTETIYQKFFALWISEQTQKQQANG